MRKRPDPMKRGIGLSQGRKALARTAVERREASASAKSGARREPAQRQRLDCAERSLSTRLSALAPFLGSMILSENREHFSGSCSWGPFVNSLGRTRGANKKRSARTMELVIASEAKQSKGGLRWR